ncbi:hypothetical protein PTSG_06285 [Salpingoeca rosetta]|uniref:N-acetyltransferase domain-containing protein n=1 Tax=Salpingoeca rosetta (strain ATCC 50818 / BSB-021) TaxID=946362 RepID=F2UCG9_SALR5|nr:uncharacterized protein PTSG_06285 [Salpingoeca rosetta]EGD74276.1 hypothetical protein PTSG_06285 [Salpingoeca rosetta]|eukprot:XP_004993176.1 hypothetical protein PTSG_06285 [Salpingoeca rosetta]
MPGGGRGVGSKPGGDKAGRGKAKGKAGGFKGGAHGGKSPGGWKIPGVQTGVGKGGGHGSKGPGGWASTTDVPPGTGPTGQQIHWKIWVNTHDFNRNPMLTFLRQEDEDSVEDRAQVRHVLVSAFPTPAEACLVDTCRPYPKPLSLSAVAVKSGNEDDGVCDGSRESSGADEIVAHILFLPVTLQRPKHGASMRSQPNVTLLAPLSVLPSCQRQGIGSKLTEWALEQQRAQGVAAVLVLGSEYYRRFGFRPVADFDLHYPDASLDPHFFCLELQQGSMSSWAGATAVLPKQFDLLEHAVDVPARDTDTIPYAPLILICNNLMAAVGDGTGRKESDGERGQREGEEGMHRSTQAALYEQQQQRLQPQQQQQQQQQEALPFGYAIVDANALARETSPAHMASTWCQLLTEAGEFASVHAARERFAASFAPYAGRAGAQEQEAAQTGSHDRKNDGDSSSCGLFGERCLFVVHRDAKRRMHAVATATDWLPSRGLLQRCPGLMRYLTSPAPPIAAATTATVPSQPSQGSTPKPPATESQASVPQPQRPLKDLRYEIVTEESSGLARLEWVAVHPQFRGMGLGRAIVHAALRMALKRGQQAAVLSTQTTTPRAVRMYTRSFGFELFSEDKAELVAKEGEEEEEREEEDATERAEPGPRQAAIAAIAHLL